MRKFALLFVISAVLLPAVPAFAYVGPGAGIAFGTGIFFMVATFFVAVAMLAIWPIRFLIVRLRQRKARKRALVKRVVVLGLDGLDPDLVEKWMAEGHLPAFSKLAAGDLGQGGFFRLGTTFPAVSPVAWSSFMTGANPGRHNIYDFLARDPRTYLPMLSSAYIGESQRSIQLGKYKIPLGKPELRLLRKSKPFWTVLGEHRIFSNIIRVPITFPPEKFNGVLISGMCVPDLRGSQGTFSFFTTRSADDREVGDQQASEGGVILSLRRDEQKSAVFHGELTGPPDGLLEEAPELTIPFSVKVSNNGKGHILSLPNEDMPLKIGEFSDWVSLQFKASLKLKVSGIARFMLTEAGDQVSLYVTPINLDPSKPVFPISHPPQYGVYMAKLIGPYANLGLAEDTWVLNERLLTDGQFLTETDLIHQEREKMFFDALKKTKQGCVVCVFDDTDRIQHMFYRYLVDDHPALREDDSPEHKDAILRLYKWSDDLLARTLKKLKKGDALIVMSDHGFKPFIRGINLNSWLYLNGYLYLKEGAKPGTGKWLSDVDWSRTRAYQVGLGGMYLNIAGREGQGIVAPEDAAALKREIIEKLRGMYDEKRGETAINDVWDAEDLYTGPYKANAPDLIIGYNVGYRASWDGTTGVVDERVLEDNTKAWSGDHCMDPRCVPGSLFTNFPINKSDPSIMDLAPTILQMLGVDSPAYMDGVSLVKKEKETAS
ncbi:MAG: alkaline phosphatase family protein [Candidatus Lernaella stagnicola]|nr:alkaline phosphatase family protein [Candidatus Lernaella stagnicola]